jgi:hypothetical protein
MIRINAHGQLPVIGLGLVILAVSPFYAAFITVGWAWRLWIAIVNHGLSFATYTRRSVFAS